MNLNYIDNVNSVLKPHNVVASDSLTVCPQALLFQHILLF